MKKVILFVFSVVMISGCGMFRSMVNKSETSDVKRQTERSEVMSELETFSADIPARYIKAIRTASGTEIVLRDSVETGNVKRQTADGETEDDETGDVNGETSNDESKVDSRKSKETGGVSINYEREERDSSNVKREMERSESEEMKKETEVESDFSWITWLLAGLAVAFALVIAGLLFFRGILP